MSEDSRSLRVIILHEAYVSLLISFELLELAWEENMLSRYGNKLYDDSKVSKEQKVVMTTCWRKYN
jgi:hypothetical protein